MAEVENEAKCRRCQELVFDQPYDVYDDQGLCIYHSDKEGKEKDFPEAKELLQQGIFVFTGFIFPKDVDFSEANFEEKADFSEVNFEGEASFMAANFEGEAPFFAANFKKYAYFSEVNFEGEADFSEANFKKEAYFSAANFEEKADFSAANFKKEAYFSEANFEEKADFSAANFEGGTSFSAANFKEKAYFRAANFYVADFTFATFMGKTEFSRARFKGAADFRGADREDPPKKEYELFSRKDDTLFLRVAFERPELVYFYRVNLSRCRFLDTDLRSVNFIGITHWHQKGWRAALYDEIYNDSSKKYPELMELYRQLKQNYEDRRNWEEAGHFHFGQMEMQLR